MPQGMGHDQTIPFLCKGEEPEHGLFTSYLEQLLVQQTEPQFSIYIFWPRHVISIKMSFALISQTEIYDTGECVTHNVSNILRLNCAEY